MNFLAHLYLSGDDHFLMVGNFMADSVKGKQFMEYPKPISNGILLHRAIDTFMDEHPIVRQGSKRLHGKYGKFGPVIMDIFYDHFLAKKWKDYHHQDLTTYAQASYQTLTKYNEYMPNRAKHILYYMSKQDWISTYPEIVGIAKILERMSRRIKVQPNFHESVNELQEFYEEYEAEFLVYWPEMIAHADEVKSTFRIQT